MYKKHTIARAFCNQSFQGTKNLFAFLSHFDSFIPTRYNVNLLRKQRQLQRVYIFICSKIVYPSTSVILLISMACFRYICKEIGCKLFEKMYICCKYLVVFAFLGMISFFMTTCCSHICLVGNFALNRPLMFKVKTSHHLAREMRANRNIIV